MSKPKSTGKSRPSDKNYKLFAVSFQGNVLASIRNEFVKEVKSSFRRNIFVLDLVERVNEVGTLRDDIKSTRKSSRKSARSGTDESRELLARTMMYIQKCRQEFEFISKAIQMERTFDLLSYWKETASADRNLLQKNNPKKDTPKKVAAGAKGKKSTNAMEIAAPVILTVKPCTKVGKVDDVATKKYIQDYPENSKLYIILLSGGEVSTDYYLGLLRQQEPLQAIIHFVPDPSYAISDKKLQTLMEMLELVNVSNDCLRKSQQTKPVGIFQDELPAISECLAASMKYTKDIYDQLSWYLYDIEMLHRQYTVQYVERFDEINVSAGEEDFDSWHTKESLSKLESEIFGVSLQGNDIATIAGYLDNLLDALERSAQGDSSAGISELGDTQITESSTMPLYIVNEKWQRIILEEADDLLKSWLAYAEEQEKWTPASIELSPSYYRMRTFLGCSGNVLIADTPEKMAHAIPTRYCEVLTTGDAFRQRVIRLMETSDDCSQVDIGERHKLYHFRRRLNTVVQTEQTFRIPTRLCFRDFCDYLADDFLETLKTSSSLHEWLTVSTSQKSSKSSSTALNDEDSRQFIRALSIKGRNLDGTARASMQRLRAPKQGRPTSSIKRSHGGGLSQSPNPLLKGYNLGDTLQELTVNRSIFRFLEGFIRLTKNSWLDGRSVTSLEFAIFGYHLHMQHCPDEDRVLPNLRWITPNDISCQISIRQRNRPIVHIIWPNGLTITKKYHPDHVEQKHLHQSEIKRLFTPCGSVIVFQRNQKIRILRFNGMICELHSPLTEKEEEEKAEEEEEEGTISSNNNLEKTEGDQAIHCEMSYVAKLCIEYNLPGGHFHLTTSEGRNFEIMKQQVVSENHKYLIFEWEDYFANECYTEREDGVRMIWTSDTLKCFHSDGTVITSRTTEGTYFLEDEFGEEMECDMNSSFHCKNATSSTSEFLHLKATSRISYTKEEKEMHLFAGYDEYMPNSQEMEGAEQETTTYEDDGTFITYCTENYLMQHKNYASVAFADYDKIQIYSPDDMAVQLEKNPSDLADDTAVHIVIAGKRLRFGIGAKGCRLHACKQPDNMTRSSHSCDLSVHFNFFSNLPEIFHAILANITSCEYGNEAGSSKDKYLLSTGDGSGFEFHSKLPLGLKDTEIVPDEVLKKFEWNVLKKQNHITFVRGLSKVKDLLTMPIENLEIDLEKFPRKLKKFETNEKTIGESKESEYPRILCARLLLEIPNNLTSINEIISFLDNIDSVALKEGQIECILNSIFIPKALQQRRKAESVAGWQIKLDEHRKLLLYQAKRKIFYLAMLRYRSYPKYWQFTSNFNGNVNNIDIDMFLKMKCCKEMTKQDINSDFFTNINMKE